MNKPDFRDTWNSLVHGCLREVVIKLLFFTGVALILVGLYKRDWMCWATGALCFYLVAEA